MTKIKLYKGDTLTEVKDDAKPLIESVLWERDIVMLLGTEKAGKSILAQQMAFALSSGTPFLERYETVRPTSILYLQTEGKDAEMARRIECMERALPIDRGNFARAYKKFLPLDVEEFKVELITLIKGIHPTPRVMFIDSLYTSMAGDLISNKDVRHLLAEITHINDMFGMACVIIHHEIKDAYDKEGEKVKQGDKRSYGSVFLRAFVEHILFFSADGDPRKDMTRMLKCETTRTGQVMGEEALILVQPDPLYFEPVGCTKATEGLIKGRLSAGSANETELKSKFGYQVPRALREMKKNGLVKKDGGLWEWVD